MTDDELIEQIAIKLDELDWGWNRDGIYEITEICKAHYRDVAVEAVKDERNNRQSGGMAELGIDCSIDAINKAFE